MLIDFNKLQGRIVEKFGTRAAFASAMGMKESVLSSRLNNKVSWTVGEISRAIQPDMLDIDPADIYAYFFTPKVL